MRSWKLTYGNGILPFYLEFLYWKCVTVLFELDRETKEGIACFDFFFF